MKHSFTEILNKYKPLSFLSKSYFFLKKMNKKNMLQYFCFIVINDKKYYSIYKCSDSENKKNQIKTEKQTKWIIEIALRANFKSVALHSIGLFTIYLCKYICIHTVLPHVVIIHRFWIPLFAVCGWHMMKTGNSFFFLFQ